MGTFDDLIFPSVVCTTCRVVAASRHRVGGVFGEAGSAMRLKNFRWIGVDVRCVSCFFSRKCCQLLRQRGIVHTYIRTYKMPTDLSGLAAIVSCWLRFRYGIMLHTVKVPSAAPCSSRLELHEADMERAYPHMTSGAGLRCTLCMLGKHHPLTGFKAIIRCAHNVQHQPPSLPLPTALKRLNVVVHTLDLYFPLEKSRPVRLSSA